MNTPADLEELNSRRDRGRGRAQSQSYDRLTEYDRMGEGDYGAAPQRDPGQRRDAGQPRRNYPPVQGQGGQHPAQANNFQLKKRIREVKDMYFKLHAEYTRAQAQIDDYQARQKQLETGQRLEVARLRKEADFHKRLRHAAEARAQGLEQQVDDITSRLAAMGTASDGDGGGGGGMPPQDTSEQEVLVQQTQMLLTKNSELSSKLQQAQSELRMQRDTVDQLTAELDLLQQEKRELMAMYDKMNQMATGKFMHENPLAHMNDDYDLELLYGDGDGYLGMGADGSVGYLSSPEHSHGGAEAGQATDTPTDTAQPQTEETDRVSTG